MVVTGHQNHVWVCPSSCFLFLLFVLLLLSVDPSLKLGSAQCFCYPSVNREWPVER
jgi:hypothetical protein